LSYLRCFKIYLQLKLITAYQINYTMIMFTVRTHGPFAIKMCYLLCAQIAYAYRQHINKDLRRHFHVHVAAVN